MKDIYQIFDEQLNNLLEMIRQSNFINCRNISVDLIRISTLSEYKDGIFISEVFESIFDQIAPLFQEYDVSKEELTSIITKLYDQVYLLSQLYRNGDKEQIYEILKELRSFTTLFQFRCWNILKIKYEDPRQLLRRKVR